MLYRYELRKLFCYKFIWIVISVGIVVNAVITVLTTKYTENEYTAHQYKSMWYILSDLSGEDAESFLEMRTRQIEALGEWQTLQLTKDVKKEVVDGNLYNEYISGVLEDAEKRVSISKLFSDSEFSKKNLEQTIKDYEKVSKKNFKAQGEKGILLILQSKVSDYMMVVLTIIIAFFLIIPEKEKKEAVLFATTTNGQSKTVKSKFMVAVSMILGIYSIMFIENIFIAHMTYGLGNPMNTIQSIDEYRECIYNLSICQFMLIVFALKLLFFILLVMMMFLICFASQSGTEIIIITSMAGIAEFVLYYFIPAGSVLSPLKYVNIISFINADRIIGKYININLIGYPVKLISVSLCAYLVIYVTIYVFFIRKWKARYLAWNRKNRTGYIYQRTYRRGLLAFESLRLERKNRMIIVFFIVTIIQILRITTYSYDNDPDKVYYRSYMQYLAELSYNEQQRYVDKENLRYESILKEKITEENRIEHGNSLLPYNAWQKVTEEYDRICMLREYGYDVQLTYAEGFEQLMGKNSTFYVTSYAILIILLILAFSGIYAIDYEENMDTIIYVTYSGKNRIHYERIKYSIIIGIICFVISYLPEYIIIREKIGLSNFNVLAKSLPFYSLSGNLKVWQCILILYVMRIIGTGILIGLISYLSAKLRNTFATMGVISCFLAIPIIFEFMRWMPVINANIII